MKELLKYWHKFCSDMVEFNPNYLNSDFTFNNFMEWYASLGDKDDSFL